MILLFDENFSPKLVAALEALGHPVDHVLRHLSRGAPDTDVFALTVHLGACLVTKDAKIRRRKHEQQAYRDAGIGVFVLTGTAQWTLTEEAGVVLGAVERVLAIAVAERARFVYEVTDRGKINRLE